ncbi:MAG: lipase [Gammaproteobacteria bacterium]|nr:lipase [Gammaproteobacteria bacterium]MBT8052267.1 lipase [Gammaproteobacteria bacterium]
MNMRVLLALIFSFFVLTTQAAPVPPATNKDGSFVSGFVTAEFDLGLAGVQTPFPFNPLFLGTTDLTLNPPVDDPNDFGDPTVALSAMDGFSTTERWVTTFNSFPNSIDVNSVVPGQSVRFFEVNTVFGTIVIVNGIARELTPGVDYVATMATDEVLAIIPLKPLKEMTTYMAVLTNDIKDTAGNNATPSPFYHLSKSQAPWLDANGGSTNSFFDNETAATLEGVRQITFPMEAAAASAGIPKEDIILSWTAQTQSITPVTKNLRSIAKPAPTEVEFTGVSTAALGLPGLADVYHGVISIPYYLGVPSAENPVAPLTDFWRAAPGAYVPPFDALGLDPTSTNITVANPFPVQTSLQTVPLLLTVPNANSGHEQPAAGWPIVIFGHGLGGNRTNLLAAADTFAAAGFAVIGIDTPLHGITPQESALALLYIENTRWADDANERTFNVDYVDNITGAPGPDGIVDASGTHIINLTSMLTSRDNARQAQADLSVLAVTLPTVDIDADGLPDLDASTTTYAGISMGGIMGTPFTAVEPLVTSSFLSVPMGGIARGLEASPTFGPSIRAGLAGLDVLPGTADFETFFTVFQTVVDSMDPINWAAEASRLNNILLHEVIGDTVVPNFVPTALLSGTEPMIATMGLTPYSSTQLNPDGLDVVGRFVPPASHGSLLSPVTSPAATVEMQKQMASFIASMGTAVVVEDAATMVPVPVAASEAAPE